MQTGVSNKGDKMKLALYVRESSKDTNLAPPIANQIERGTDWAFKHEHEIINIYQDNGFSGGDWSRPAWNQCKKDAKRHMFVLLWVWNQDRIARDTEQFLSFYRILNVVGVKVYSETEGMIDMTTLGGRVKHTAMAQASEIFRLITSDKVKQAYKSKKNKYGDSLKWGRPKIKVDEELILQWHDYGFGYRKIAEHHSRLKTKISYATVKRVIDKSKRVTK